MNEEKDENEKETDEKEESEITVEEEEPEEGSEEKETEEKEEEVEESKVSKEEKVDSFKREMHQATCADCGKECEVPFKPIEGRAVYCRDCYRKHAPRRRY